MVEAIVYRLRVGCPWRDLPERFGCWSSVFTRWSRWNKAGLWTRVLALLTRKAKGVLRHLGATHIKVHQHGSNPAGGQQNQAIGRTKGGLNSKLTALVEGRGRALQLHLAPGQRADIRAADDLTPLRGSRVVADKGYDSDDFRHQLADTGTTHCIPPRAGRKSPAAYHRGYYRQRHRVENFFQRLKRFRSVASRFDKTDRHFLASLSLASILDWLNYTV
jgi:transposase